MSLSRERKLKEWYSDLERERTSYLNRAKEASRLTIPWLIPKEGTRDGDLPVTHQSIGAEGVTNLASRLTTVHLPPTRSFFRLRVPRKTIEESGHAQKNALVPGIEAGLSRIEQEVLGHNEALGDRASVYIMMMHLIVAGNVLAHVKPDGVGIYSLRSYVVERDPDDNILVIITKEEIAHSALSEELRKRIKTNNIENSEDSQFETHEIYTCIKREAKQWVVYQECEGVRIGKEGYHPLDLCPWLPLRLFRSGQEDYGRGYVEMYRGDLNTCEVLTKALTEASAAAAKVLFLVNPSSFTKAGDLTAADNLSFVIGKREDIGVLQLEKYNDLQVAERRVKELEQKLARVFLLHTAVRRDAERVTAEEIRYMAQELESMLGGLYSMLAKEWQEPYARLRIHYLQEDDKLDPFPDGIEVEIITGVEALGRGQEASTLMAYTNAISQFVDPKNLGTYMNIGGLLKMLGAAFGVDTTALLKSDEQQQEEAAREQEQAMMARMGPNLVNAGSNLLGKAMEPQQQIGGK